MQYLFTQGCFFCFFLGGGGGGGPLPVHLHTHKNINIENKTSIIFQEIFMLTDLFSCCKVNLSNSHFPFLILALDFRTADVLTPITGIKIWKKKILWIQSALLHT